MVRSSSMNEYQAFRHVSKRDRTTCLGYENYHRLDCKHKRDYLYEHFMRNESSLWWINSILIWAPKIIEKCLAMTLVSFCEWSCTNRTLHVLRKESGLAPIKRPVPLDLVSWVCKYSIVPYYDTYIKAFGLQLATWLCTWAPHCLW